MTHIKKDKIDWMDVIDLNTKQIAEQASICLKVAPAIQFLAEPDEIVQLAAVKKNPHVLSHIKNPTEAAIIMAVTKCGHAIKHIKHPTSLAQLVAIGETRNAFRHIKKPTQTAIELNNLLYKS